MKEEQTEPLERIAQSLENIEKLLTRYYTEQSSPAMVIQTDESKTK